MIKNAETNIKKHGKHEYCTDTSKKKRILEEDMNAHCHRIYYICICVYEKPFYSITRKHFDTPSTERSFLRDLTFILMACSKHTH